MPTRMYPDNFTGAVEVWRYAAFSCGVLAVAAVWATSLRHMDHQSLTAHMIQHLVLMTVAAPLMLLGAPRRSFWRVSTQPLLCWLAGTACVIWWHIPGAFEFGQQAARWHQFEMATFFVAGLLFWWPVVQCWPNADSRPQWLIVMYLFLATLPCDALSAFLTFCGRVVYVTDGCCSRVTGGPALRDQEIAGALMWAWVTFAYTIPAVIVAFRILSGEPRPKRLLAFS